MINKIEKNILYNCCGIFVFNPTSLIDAICLFIDYFVNLIKFIFAIFVRMVNIQTKLVNNLIRPTVPFGFLAKINIKGKEIKVKIRKNRDDFYILNPFYEKNVMKYFNPKKGDTVIDVGAHVGKYTLYASKCVGKEGKVISIEPNRETFEALKENVKINKCKNVVAYNIAATKSKRKVKLFIPKDERRSSIVEKRAEYYQLVDGIPLYILLKKNDAKVINWVKIDVEGAEIIVLQGMKNFLKKVKNLIIEVQNKNETKIRKILKENFKKYKVVFVERNQKYYLAQN